MRVIWLAAALAVTGACDVQEELSGGDGIISPADTGGGSVAGDIGGAGGGDGGSVAGDAVGPGETPDFQDGPAIVAWLVDVARACPQVSKLTVPGGWAMSMVGDKGCMLYTPAWIASDDGTTWSWVTDAQRSAGFLIVAGAMSGTGWDEVSLAGVVVDALRAQYPDLAVLAADSADDPFGTGWRIRTLIVRFTNGALPSVGIVRVVHGGCSVPLDACPLTASALWAPLATLPAQACTLAQVEASFHCPQAGGSDCEEGPCNEACKAGGSDHGYCSGNNCVCV